MKIIKEIDDKCEKDTIKAFSMEVKEEDAVMIERAKKMQKAFQNPINKDLKDWFLLQLCQYRLVDKKNDIDPEIKRLVFRELAGMFQFLSTPITEEKSAEDKKADQND